MSQEQKKELRIIAVLNSEVEAQVLTDPDLPIGDFQDKIQIVHSVKELKDQAGDTPDLVILDVDAPGSKLLLTRRSQGEEDSLVGVPVVAISSDSPGEFNQFAERARFKVVYRPYNSEELTSVIEQALKEPENA
jgi:DNA-binding response OmpR family regulator